MKSLKQDIEFPYEATNFKRIKKSCIDKEDLLQHIICRKELKPITQIITAGISPDYFISDMSFTLISQYMKFKRYGMSFLYPSGVNEIPNIVLQSFDIIQNTLDKQDSDKMKALREKNK